MTTEFPTVIFLKVDVDEAQVRLLYTSYHLSFCLCICIHFIFTCV